jgi:hypothetical protein
VETFLYVIIGLIVLDAGVDLIGAAAEKIRELRGKG